MDYSINEPRQPPRSSECGSASALAPSQPFRLLATTLIGGPQFVILVPAAPHLAAFILDARLTARSSPNERTSLAWSAKQTNGLAGGSLPSAPGRPGCAHTVRLPIFSLPQSGDQSNGSISITLMSGECALLFTPRLVEKPHSSLAPSRRPGRLVARQSAGQSGLVSSARLSGSSQLGAHSLSVPPFVLWKTEPLP